MESQYINECYLFYNVIVFCIYITEDFTVIMTYKTAFALHRSAILSTQ